MGLSVSLLVSSSKETLKKGVFGLTENVEKVIVRTVSFDPKDGGRTLRTVSFKKCNSGKNDESEFSEELVVEESVSFRDRKPKKLKLETTVSFKNLVFNGESLDSDQRTSDQEEVIIDNIESNNSEKFSAEPEILFSPRPVSELDEAAVKVQKVYKSYRTRRNLADCAVVVEELWWKALDFAALKRSSVSFFNIEKPESAASRWARARTRVAKVGKGLSKDEKAQKLALLHWLEAIDPRHRYGHNLHMYYDVWFGSQSSQPFFYWLDIGDGKEVNLETCPRTTLQSECIIYLGPKERKAYEVIVESGKLVYRYSGLPVDTIEGSKWIFVLSTSRTLYVGQKKKGHFQHSSFLSGGATTASGRLVAHNGILEAIWAFSGHYRPTEENFIEFISFLEEKHVDLSNVKKCPIDDDIPPPISNVDQDPKSESTRVFLPETIQSSIGKSADEHNFHTSGDDVKEPFGKRVSPKQTIRDEHNFDTVGDNLKEPFGKRVSSKWTTGTGPRINCVREYPPKLQFQALEHVKLSPRINSGPILSGFPIPSPRPSVKVHLSPRLVNMALPSPRLHVCSAN